MSHFFIFLKILRICETSLFIEGFAAGLETTIGNVTECTQGESKNVVAQR